MDPLKLSLKNAKPRSWLILVLVGVASLIRCLLEQKRMTQQGIEPVSANLAAAP